MLADNKIIENMRGIRECLMPFLEWNQGNFVNNLDWYNVNYLDILRDIGTHFTINRMLTMESVKLRLEKDNPMTFLEFNYMILQSYDFRELSRTQDVTLQIGGSDQWGIIVCGADLVRRCDQKTVYRLPLVRKMGKSEQGAVWLSKDKTSVYDYWQFWRNTEDKDVGRYLRLFTDLPLDTISSLESLVGKDINYAKIILATEATKIAHGEELAKLAENQSTELFCNKMQSGNDDLTVELSSDKSERMATELFVLVGLTGSKSDSRRLIKSKGLKVNDVVLNSDRILKNDIVDGVIKLSVGKKHHRFAKFLF